MSRFRIERLADHDRTGFRSGSDPLDLYFAERAMQDVRRRMGLCFVAIDSDQRIAGFYTLAATSLAFDRLALERAKRLPRYPVVPAVLLGRLAVAVAHQGKGLGGVLVADAIQRATRSDVLGYAMVVDAKDDAAAAFYAHLGFERLAEDGRRLIRPI
jgi:predicted N-acetyltransferase YhbS